MRTALLLIGTAVAACAGSSGGGGPAVVGPAADERATLLAEARAEFNGRADVATLDRAIALYERALVGGAGDVAAVAELARAHQLRGYAHSGGAASFERGMDWADRGLRASFDRYAQLRSSGVKIEDAVAALDRSAAPLVYWYAINLGSFANAKGQVEGIKQKDRLVALMKWVLDNDPRYHFHGADRFFGAFYSAIPEFIGGDLAKSEKHFRAAIAGAPQFPGNYLLMAEYWATASSADDERAALLAKVQAMAPCTAGGPNPCIIEGWAVEAELDRKKAAELAN